MWHLKRVFVILMMVLSITLLANEKSKDIKKLPTLVSKEWLKTHINNPNLVILDVRKRALYDKGHLLHAVNLPTFKKLFDKDLYIPKIDILKETFSSAGVDDDSLVVIYDNGDFIWAARCYWLLEVLGHKNVGLLQDNYIALKKSNFKISTENYIPRKKDFIPMLNNEMIETKLSTLVGINQKTIIDGRPKEYYEGLKSSANRYGHIKSALNYPGSMNSKKSKDGAHILNIDELGHVYKDLDRKKPIILYCMDGADAAMNYIVLKELGYKASVYEAGWLEWGNDHSLPMEGPSKE
jgi:thiosulfate/3-mercaptopyruvate sulfurtransferase